MHKIIIFSLDRPTPPPPRYFFPLKNVDFWLAGAMSRQVHVGFGARSLPPRGEPLLSRPCLGFPTRRPAAVVPSALGVARGCSADPPLLPRGGRLPPELAGLWVPALPCGVPGWALLGGWVYLGVWGSR